MGHLQNLKKSAENDKKKKVKTTYTKEKIFLNRISDKELYTQYIKSLTTQ